MKHLILFLIIIGAALLLLGVIQLSQDNARGWLLVLGNALGLCLNIENYKNFNPCKV